MKRVLPMIFASVLLITSFIVSQTPYHAWADIPINTTPFGCPIPANFNSTSANTDPFPNVTAGQTLYICGWHAQVFATASPTAEWAYSNAANSCGGLTAATANEPYFTLAPGAGLNIFTYQSSYPVIESSPGMTVCFRNLGTNPTSIGTAWYTIQNTVPVSFVCCLLDVLADSWRPKHETEHLSTSVHLRRVWYSSK